jgi:hypothetical protein
MTQAGSFSYDISQQEPTKLKNDDDYANDPAILHRGVGLMLPYS